MMKEKDRIREQLAELLERYYDGSFARMTCDYIRFTQMTPEKVKGLLETMRKELVT